MTAKRRTAKAADHVPASTSAANKVPPAKMPGTIMLDEGGRPVVDEGGRPVIVGGAA